MAHFEIRNLSFSYPGSSRGKALDNVNLTIERGEYLTVCGKSGSGKTTLLRHLKSVLAPHGKLTGEILFNGRPLQDADLRTQSAGIGYVMQNPDSQIVTDKVWHELAFGLESLGTDQKTIRLRVAEMASYFGIQGWFHRNVAELSGGQKQLLNLASIMAMQPEVLILDEPTSQLDPIAASDFLNTVRKINLELGTTIIITEHRLEDIFHASDRVALMEGGRITACDTPRRVGDRLKYGNNDMFAAMPAPVQIYYSLKDRLKTPGECPLTVREGRNWLSGIFAESEPTVTEIEKEEFGEIGVPAISVKEVWYRYEKNAPDVLRSTSLGVQKGSFHAIVGGNGTGKSTMLKAICGICKPYRGNILINGKKLEKYKDGELFSSNLAMLPQDARSIFVKKTVREDLEEMTAGGDEGEAAIAEVAEICDISHLLDTHPYDLSGGEQQRAALAKVLLTRPQILLMDEPTKGMDSFFKRKFAEIIGDLKSRGVTVLMVSHDVEFCAAYTDVVSMFFDGGIVTTDTPNSFFSRNSFYTTAANRMSRHIFANAINNEDVTELCIKNL
ncbi:MAG: ATP-binding cassette domain-containing protein [Clostridiales bacterium]|nr:ATP-binding cassette domain-containing protein [Clostridiales bacterium]